MSLGAGFRGPDPASAAPSFAEIYAQVQAERAAVEPYLRCPISGDVPDLPLLASDGHLYDAEALRQWADRCARSMAPLRSPVTREVLRCWALDARGMLAPLGFCFDAAAAPARLPLPSLRPPFPAQVEVMRGSRRADAWSDALGTACRVLLGWHDGDAAEWCFPYSSEGREVLTPPPAAELLPLAAPLRGWLGLDGAALANPAHLLTAWVRIVRPGLRPARAAAGKREDPDAEAETGKGATPWRTFEQLFLALNGLRRAA